LGPALLYPRYVGVGRTACAHLNVGGGGGPQTAIGSLRAGDAAPVCGPAGQAGRLNSLLSSLLESQAHSPTSTSMEKARRPDMDPRQGCGMERRRP
jgi:hypothetical protein